jgi:hypothetical protein
MGSVTEAFTPGTFTEHRRSNPSGSAGCCSGGVLSNGGAMLIGSKMSLAGLTDGSSNVMMVSETGNFLVTQNGAKVDWRPCQPHGFIIGYHTHNFPGNGGDNRTFNCTTVRYRINQFTRIQEGLTNAPGNCGSLGICDNASANHPLTSGHPGGVHVLLGDASVRFMDQSAPLDLLARMATRDDGIPVLFE